MEPEIIQETAVAVRERDGVLLTPVMDIETAMNRLRVFQEFCASYLQPSQNGGEDGGDYGIIPGTKKKTLLKSGAEKLCEVYGLYDQYVFESKVEDWEKGLFDYVVECVLRSRRDDSIVGSGLGSCSSFESKYRYRDAQRKCPTCGAAAIIKGKDFKNDGKPTGWVCFTKKGGCNAKFRDGDPAIESQTLGRVDNPDIIDVKNTVLKIAKKRAKVDAVIGVTRSSGIFSQDLEEFQVETKPEPPKTTEDIEIGNSGVSASAEQGPANIPDNRGGVGRAAPPVPEPPTEQSAPPPKYASLKQTQALYMKFREALPEEYRNKSDRLLREYLGRNGFFDAQGEPSAYAIPQDRLAEIGRAALRFARELPTTAPPPVAVPVGAFRATNDDIPF